MSVCCCSLAGTAACQTCSQNPFAVMSKMMTPQPTALRDIMVNPQIEKPQTNYDLLISKTPEELAEWLDAIIYHAESDNCGKSCPLYSYCIESNGVMLDWLKAPVEEVDNGT